MLNVTLAGKIVNNKGEHPYPTMSRKMSASTHGQRKFLYLFITLSNFKIIFSYSHQIWNGNFVWSREVSFECTLTAVSNRGAFKVGKELPDVLHVVGKSASKGVWDYVSKLKDSWDKQVILLVVEPPYG